MKLYIFLALVLMALGSLAEKIKGRQSFILPSDSRLRRIELLRKQNNYWDADADDEQLAENIQMKPRYVLSEALKPDSAQGRLFFKKFFLMGGKQSQQQQQQPQIIIIRPPAPSRPTQPTSSTLTSTFPITSTGTSNGTVTVSEVDARGGDESDDYITDDDDDVYEDETMNGKANTFKLVKGKRTQQGLNFVVPSNYMRFFQNNPNSLVVNPSALYNNGVGVNKIKNIRLGNINDGNVKRKRSKRPVRRFVSQN